MKFRRSRNAPESKAGSLSFSRKITLFHLTIRISIFVTFAGCRRRKSRPKTAWLRAQLIMKLRFAEDNKRVSFSLSREHFIALTLQRGITRTGK